MSALGMLDYSDYPVERHHHLHHIFPGNGADHLHHGTEVEFARGCPYSCTFCDKTLFRNKYRERQLPAVLAEIDHLIARGVDYIYFIDEIFGVDKTVKTLLQEIAHRPISIGFQIRIDLWNEELLDRRHHHRLLLPGRKRSSAGALRSGSLPRFLVRHRYTHYPRPSARARHTDYLQAVHIPRYAAYLSFTRGPALQELEQRFGARLFRQSKQGGMGRGSEAGPV